MRDDARSRRVRFPLQNNNNSSSVVTSSSSNSSIFGSLKTGSANMLEDLLMRHPNLEQHSQQHQQKSLEPVVTIEKKYKCLDQLCPYQSNCKSQFENHSSCHNAKTSVVGEEVYRCPHCTYNVSHRHLLLQHLKIHTHDSVDDPVDLTDEPVETGNVIFKPSRFIYFCRHCPARYLSKFEIDQHLSMHDAGHVHKCRLCSYTAVTESNMQAHLTAHSSYYQEKTKEFQRKYQTDKDHPMPRIEPEAQPSTSNETREQSWIVVAPPPLPPNLLKTLHDQKMFSLLSLLTKCKFCPFNAETPDALQAHLVHHKRFSGQEFPCKCEHCDYSASTIPLLTEHLKLHFLFIQHSRVDLMNALTAVSNNSSENGKPVSFYTNYEQLELKCVDLSKVKDEKMDEENPDFVFNENADLAKKNRRLDIISNVSNKDKIIVRLD